MKNEQDLLEQFNITELEDRLEFGICGGGGGDGGDGGTGGGDPGPGGCSGVGDQCDEQ